ncbi:flagellar protein FhlB [Saccharophagus sp. K07]|nr:EscU/YscU/HrcU family type III secretion system export apparatus switch protein [Saccharophagus sp. K07]MBC6906750.1 flagellar protein FhlB [Saccharophagus sp. K07]
MRPKLEKAVALFYDGRGAPQVTAKGEGAEAEQIIALAREHGVPLCDNPALVELLTQIEIGDHIPEELYIAVAHVIAFAYRLRMPDSVPPIPPLNSGPQI